MPILLAKGTGACSSVQTVQYLNSSCLEGGGGGGESQKPPKIFAALER